MTKTHSSMRRWLAWAVLVGALVVAVAGFGVHPGSAADPRSSFRCPPPLVSAWGHANALERSSAVGWVADREVEVRCGAPARRRMALAFAGVGITVFLVVGEGGRPLASV
ncbi:MAG: hypothetical protein ACR2HY_09925 [Acidimicrobiales bacterium]